MGSGSMKAATAEATSDRVCGVLRSKIDPAAVDRALERVDIHPSSTTKLEGKVELLYEHYQALPNAADVIGPCDVCGGESDPNDGDECPYCGTKEGASDPAQASAEVGDPPESGELSEDDEPAPGNDDEDVTMEEAVEAAVTEPAPAAPPSPASPDQKLVPRPRGAKKAAKKAEKPAKGSTAMVKAEAGKGAAVLRDPKPDNVIENEAEGLKQLDAKVAEIRSIDREKTWALISKLGEIFQSQLWKLRHDGEGKPKYRVFEDFCLEELDFTRQYVQQMIQIGSRFSEKELIEHGVTKLRAVLAAPPAKQAEAFDRLKHGASRREIEKQFQRARPVGPKSKKPTSSKKTTSAKSGSMTVALVEMTKTVKLFKKPATKDADPVRAKRLADLPHGYLDLENDVRMWVTVGADRNGELVAKINFGRQSPTE